MVCNLNPGVVRTEFFGSVIGMMMHDVRNGKHVSHLVAKLTPPQLTANRNMAVEDMLQTDSQWLFFLDSDVTFPADTLDRLLEIADPEERPIVTGVYIRVDQSGRLVPCVFRTALAEGGVQMLPYEGLPKDDVVEVDGCGAGHCSFTVLCSSGCSSTTACPAPWFAEDTYDSKTYSEDLTFCMRARNLGHRIYADTGINLGHVKHTILWTADL